MENEDGRYKGTRKDDGKIIKGTMKEAPLKLKASSIPSKIENIIFNNHHKAAFGNSQERFYTSTNEKLSMTPGPGNYDSPALYKNVDSRKGFGFFASQTTLSRFNDKRNWNPGPGKYEVQKQKKPMRSRSSYMGSSVQARELFKNQLQAAISNPGPGKYEERLFRSSSLAAPVFKSKNTRFSSFENGNPGVGNYDWEKVRTKIKSLWVQKKKESAELDEKSFQKKYLDKIVSYKIDPDQERGPGKYTPSLMDTKRTFSIKDDRRDRFGVFEERRKAIMAIEENGISSDVVVPPKKINSHASVFNSKSRRYQFGQLQSRMTGDPAKYSPSKKDKYSHLVNFSKKWI